jgi:hypothetical protein
MSFDFFTHTETSSYHPRPDTSEAYDNMSRIARLTATMVLIAGTLAHPLRDTATDLSLAASEKPWTCGFNHSSNNSTMPPTHYENFMQMSALDDGKNITVPTVIHYISAVELPR